jgi:hypothetical protein
MFRGRVFRCQSPAPIHRRGARLGGLAALAIASLVAAPGATAAVSSAGGLKYVNKKVEVHGKSRASGVAECPKHTRVLGGGELNGGGYGSIKLAQSFPEGKGMTPDDGWEVRVRNSKSKRVSVRFQAICGRTRVQYEKHRFNAPAMAESGEQDLDCPSNTFVYSGGVKAASSSSISLNSLFPLSGDTTWGAYVDNHGAKTKATLYALCGRKKTVDVSQEIVGNAPGTEGGTTTPPCSAKKHAYGVGLATNAGYGALAITSLGQIPASGKPGREARGLGDVTGPYSVDITVHVVCGPSLG